MAVVRLTRAQVLAWRLSAHGLDRRLPAARRGEALHPAGLRSGAPGSAAAGWHARAEGVGPGDVDDAVRSGRLVEAPTWRGTRVLDPADLPTVTAGALPPDDAALVDRLRRPRLVRDVDPAGLLEAGAEAARGALCEHPRTLAELSRLVTAAVPAGASAHCRACDAVHVDQGLFGMVALAVAWVREPGGARFTLPPAPPADPAAAAAALLAWHLRSCAPTTPEDLATHLGVGRREAAARWDAAPPLAEVESGGRRAWVPAADLAGLRRAAPGEGVRLLPPYDAALEAPDRAVLVPDEAARREVWRLSANPGVALVDGAVSCTWRATLRAGRLQVRLAALDGWRPAHLPRVEEELAAVAALRGAGLGEVSGPR